MKFRTEQEEKDQGRQSGGKKLEEERDQNMRHEDDRNRNGKRRGKPLIIGHIIILITNFKIRTSI